MKEYMIMDRLAYIAKNIESGAEALLIQGAAYNYAEDYRENTYIKMEKFYQRGGYIQQR